jgi:hypothetical protein
VTPRRALCIAILVLAASCEQNPDTDPLGSLRLDVPQGDDTMLVSLPVDPERAMVIVGVVPEVTEGVEATYLGYVTRCGNLCGVHTLDGETRDQVERAVEGTVPIQVLAGTTGPHLLLSFDVTDGGREILEEDECIAVQAVELELDDGERIRVTRRDMQFLWIISHPDADCLRNSRMMS